MIARNWKKEQQEITVSRNSNKKKHFWQNLILANISYDIKKSRLLTLRRIFCVQYVLRKGAQWVLPLKTKCVFFFFYLCSTFIAIFSALKSIGSIVIQHLNLNCQLRELLELPCIVSVHMYLIVVTGTCCTAL